MNNIFSLLQTRQHIIKQYGNNLIIKSTIPIIDCVGEIKHPDGPMVVKYSTDGECTAIGDENGRVTIMKNKVNFLIYKTHTQLIHDILWDDNHILTASADGSCKMFDCNSEDLITSLNTISALCLRMKSIKKRNTDIYLIGDSSGKIYNWDIRTHPMHYQHYASAGITSLASISDHTFVYGTSITSSIFFCDDRKSESPLFHLNHNNNANNGINSIDVTETTILASTTGKYIYEYDLLNPDSKRVQLYIGRESANFYTRIKYGNGKYIASGSHHEHTIYIWKRQPCVQICEDGDLIGYNPIIKINYHEKEVTSVDFKCTMDSFPELVTCSDDMIVSFWNENTIEFKKNNLKQIIPSTTLAIKRSRQLTLQDTFNKKNKII